MLDGVCVHPRDDGFVCIFDFSVLIPNIYRAVPKSKVIWGLAKTYTKCPVSSSPSPTATCG